MKTTWGGLWDFRRRRRVLHSEGSERSVRKDGEDEEEEESGQHTLPSIHGMLECGVGVVLEGVRERGDA